MRYYKLLILSALAFFLAGCASNASIDNMIIRKQMNKSPVSKSVENNIEVGQVSGGHETNPLWTSEINNQGFKEALKESLEVVSLYGGKNSKYKLNVKMLALKQPIIGFNYTVTCIVQYRLVNIKTGRLLYNRIIKSNYTAKFTDDVYAVSRLKDANEGAARNNITKLIADLYNLKIKSNIRIQ